MKLLVPHTGIPQATDARLMRLAEFLGITCQPLFLETRDQDHAGYLEKIAGNTGNCFVVNPRVIREWTGGVFSHGLAACMTSHFPYLLVHGLSPDAFCKGLAKVLSSGRLQSVQPVADSGQFYEVASDTREVCGPFSGMSFGPVNPANDHVLSVNADHQAMRTPISIGGGAFMALTKRDAAEIIVLAGADTFDVNANVGDNPFSEYFSRFMPHAMALRYIFGEQSWHPCEPRASFIIDDPLLRPKYGYLDFASLLDLMKKCNFSTTIAFIPHNYRRNSKRIVQMFRQNSDRLAICYHGNDHTAAECASTDTSQLNTMIRIAEARMENHTHATRLPCPKVMVFPQEKFSVEAMKVLKSHNFCAAVNAGPYPAGRRELLTLGEFAQPAIRRYGEFPLFLRRYIIEIKKEDIAFNLFFGRPVFVVEHHDVFRQVERLVETVRMINSIAPEIRWCDLGSAVMNSTLRRRTPNGVCHVRAYSSAVRIANDGDSRQRFLVEWSHSGECPSIERVLRGGVPVPGFEVDGSTIRLSTELAAQSSETFSVVYRNDFSSLEKLGFRYHAKAFMRRRLSEVRDNYISKNDLIMAVAQSLQRRFL